MPRPIPVRRPAETTTVALGLAVLLARVLGLDDQDALTVAVAVVAAAPAAVTWLVTRRRSRP